MSVRMAIINNQQTTDLDKAVEEKEPWCIFGRVENWFSHYGKQYGSSSKN